MKIIAWNKETNLAVTPERSPNDNEWAAWVEGGVVKAKKEYHEPIVKTASEIKTASETLWQDSELKKYDEKLQPDRPNAARILEYRQELRDYILHDDFPNGTRPEL